MILPHVRTLRGRLFLLIGLLTIPIALLTFATAWSTYRTVLRGLDEAQIETASNFAVRTRVWMRTAQRVATSAAAVIDSGNGDPASCAMLLERIIGEMPGFELAAIWAADRPGCQASAAATGVSAADLAELRRTLGQKPPAPSWGPDFNIDARYSFVQAGGAGRLAIFCDVRLVSGRQWQTLLLISPDLLDQVFSLGPVGEGVLLSLITGDGQLVVSRGAGDDDRSWLPEGGPRLAASSLWTEVSQGGETRSYAVRAVAEPELYALASFSDGPRQNARLQFAVMLGAPLLTLAVLVVAYVRTVNRELRSSVMRIGAVARARSAGLAAKVKIDDDMALEAAEVASAFNDMIEVEATQKRSLQVALDVNERLVRELHHRVKNSLQVVQSYLGVTRRELRDEAREVLAAAECRVNVLSAAYRIALAEGEMRPVPVDPFLREVASVVASLIRLPRMQMTVDLDTAVELRVDRAVPLGLLAVDVLERSIRPASGLKLTLIGRRGPDGLVDLLIQADQPVHLTPPPRFVAGLLVQLEAMEVEDPDPTVLCRWRFAPDGAAEAELEVEAGRVPT